MKLHVKNLGPLQDVELPIRPLTVIIGPNNQGKTWLAYLAYAAMKAQGAPPLSFESDLPQPIMEGQLTAVLDEIRAPYKTALEQIGERLPAFFQDSSGVFAQGVVAMTFDDEELISAIRQQRRIKARVSEVVLPSHVSGMEHSPTGWTLSGWLDLIHGVWEELPLHPIALPAERNALILTYKMLSFQRLRLLREGRRRRYLPESQREVAVEQDKFYREFGEPRFPEPVEDFLEFLASAEMERGLSIDSRQLHRDSACIRLADRLEWALLGSHRLSWQPTGLGGKELMLRVGDGKPIDLHNASSAVKQIAPLLLWLRSGRAHNLLIVDEPELNLHPESQAKVLEAMAMLVRLGVRVILTTHSPYLMSHLNNLIAGHPTDPELRKRQAQHLYLGDPEAFLRPEEVGAWQLDQGVLKDLYDPDWGIRWDTLSHASEDMQRRYFAIRAEEGGSDGQAG